MTSHRLPIFTSNTGAEGSHATQHVWGPSERLPENYPRIPREKTALLSHIHTFPANPNEYLRGGRNGHRVLKARRVAHLASETTGNRPRTVLLVYYKGRDARQAFNHDLVQFSQKRSGAGFFIDDSPGVPVIVFEDALIPLANVMKAHNYSRLMMFYIDYRLQSQPDDYSNIWINPRTGEIWSGIPGPRLDYTWEAFPIPRERLSPPLSIEYYGDSTEMVNYLKRCFTDKIFLSSCYLIHRHGKVNWLGLNARLKLLPGSAVSLSENAVIAWSRNPSEHDRDKVWTCKSATQPERFRSSEQKMNDGTQRYCIPISFEGWNMCKFHFTYVPAHDWFHHAAAAWLSQAQSILRQTHRRTLEDVAIIYSVEIVISMDYDRQVLYSRDRRDDRMIQTGSVFLFITPPPKSWGIKDMVSWMSNPEDILFWSFDENGSTRLSDLERQEQGFPRPLISLTPLAQTLRQQMYSSTVTWQESKDFDPTTREFSQHLCYPAMEVSREFAGRQEYAPEITINSAEGHRVSYTGNDCINHHMFRSSKARNHPRIAISHNDDLVPLLQTPKSDSESWPTPQEFIDRLERNFDFIESDGVIYTQRKISNGL
ncbi:hypothetical protein PM082_016599 [Marasmius tenuissimus]|nr:hypothetical protein PM082_016599 [Marasmius tenuissimus]